MTSLQQFQQFHSRTVVSVDDLAAPDAYAGQTAPSPYGHSIWDGDKFAGGFGETQLLQADYWTLRARSEQLFSENLYASGLIERLITNEINTGLTPEASPDEAVIGVPEDSLDGWTEDTETRFSLWGKRPTVCDWLGESTFGAIQRQTRAESLIAGDVLVVLRQNAVMRVPQVQLISGSAVMTPFDKSHGGKHIEHGVELDKNGRQVAYHVRQADGTFKRIPARGPRTGRRMAWLVYGSRRRIGKVRGEPLLATVLQSLKEIDRYRDSTQRKAVINSLIAMIVTKDEDKMGTLPIQGAAVKRGTTSVTDSTTGSTPRKFNVASHLPGVVIDEMQKGEDVKFKGGEGTDTSFAAFEESIIQAVAWSRQVPPEILRLAFSNNYSASQAAINEYKIYINLVWSDVGEQFCAPVYEEWVISEALAGRASEQRILDVWRDPSRHAEYAAWVSADWYGSIKPSTDMYKQAKGSKLLVEEAWSTNAREARVTTGTKFSKNIKRLTKENEQKAQMLRPLLELKQEFGLGTEETKDAVALDEDEVNALIEEYLNDV